MSRKPLHPSFLFFPLFFFSPFDSNLFKVGCGVYFWCGYVCFCLGFVCLVWFGSVRFGLVWFGLVCVYRFTHQGPKWVPPDTHSHHDSTRETFPINFELDWLFCNTNWMLLLVLVPRVSLDI